MERYCNVNNNSTENYLNNYVFKLIIVISHTHIKAFNQFHPNDPILYPLKISENFSFLMFAEGVERHQ